jgi:DNA-directed RNA polymerase specialized sigma24 family protein
MDTDPEESLRTALEALPEEMRRCFLLRFGQGFEEEEIAFLLKIPVERVLVYLRQVAERLPSRRFPPLERGGRRGIS